MPRKDGVRGNSKRKDNYSNSNYRQAHSDSGVKGGKKTAKKLTVKREVAILSTPFLQQDFEIAKQIAEKSKRQKIDEEAFIQFHGGD